MNIGLIIGIIIIAIALWVVWAYNAFIRLINRTDEAWADIDVQLKRRYDLIPNLVETVKGYAAHERGTLDEVTQARTQATQVHVDPKNITPEQIQAMAGAEAALTQSLGKLLAISENYPDLKANENFLSLQDQLEGTENRITQERKNFNTSVQDFNSHIRHFPTNLLVGIFGFSPKGYFQAQEGSEKAPTVQF